MPRVSAEKSAELESFWRPDHGGWEQSVLNQRDYCELQGAAAEPVRQLARRVQSGRSGASDGTAVSLWRIWPYGQPYS